MEKCMVRLLFVACFFLYQCLVSVECEASVEVVFGGAHLLLFFKKGRYIHFRSS